MSLCGIDEAGRGCIAGDMVIAGVILKKKIAGLTDSKKISTKKRELLYPQIVESALYHIVSFSPQKIDEIGLSACLKEGLLEITSTLSAKHYLFDGNTNFGLAHIEHQIKADQDVAEVSAASILAKVTKDRSLCQAGAAFSQFSFCAHQGYGTKKHIEEIRAHGYTSLHRRSYKIKALHDLT